MWITLKLGIRFIVANCKYDDDRDAVVCTSIFFLFLICVLNEILLLSLYVQRYYTGPIDTYFADLGWPKLEYRSLDFERKVAWDTQYFQPMSVVNHPGMDDNYTRIVEYKHLLHQSSPHTVYFIERSKDGGEPYYPVPNKENKDLYKKYQDMALQEPNVIFVGRLANYKYFNMDQAILNALEMFDKSSSK